MPERLEKLRATIEDLENELDSLTTVDTETRHLLEQAVAEIQTAMHKRDPSQLRHQTLSAQLTGAAEQFESSHPNLFGIVSRIIDALAQMGI